MVRFHLDEATRPARSTPSRSTPSFAQYRDTVSIDIDTVLAQYEPTDLARRVVGVGSVGTRCYLQLLQGADEDALLLQVKEAGESVLCSTARIPQPARITEGVAAHGEGVPRGGHAARAAGRLRPVPRPPARPTAARSTFASSTT